MLQLRPYDVLVFGDGKPFNASIQNFRKSHFFLNPIPIVSAINKSSQKKVSLEFLALKKENEFFFKTPVDILKVKEDNSLKVPVLKSLGNEYFSNEEISHILDYQEDRKAQPMGHYISEGGLINYLLGEDLKEEDIKPLYKTEPRVGIAIDRISRTTKEGYLYFQEFIRFDEDVSIVVKTKEDIDNLGTLIIGGEGRISITECLNTNLTVFDNIKSRVKEKVKQTGYFKIVLLTASNGIADIEGASLVLQNSYPVINYSSWISWLDGKGFPSRIFRIIPEGSVFYFKLEEENKLDEIFDRFWLKPSFYINEYPFFDAKDPVGFGLSIIGAIDVNE